MPSVKTVCDQQPVRLGMHTEMRLDMCAGMCVGTCIGSGTVYARIHRRHCRCGLAIDAVMAMHTSIQTPTHMSMHIGTHLSKRMWRGVARQGMVLAWLDLAWLSMCAAVRAAVRADVRADVRGARRSG